MSWKMVRWECDRCGFRIKGYNENPHTVRGLFCPECDDGIEMRKVAYIRGKEVEFETVFNND